MAHPWLFALGEAEQYGISWEFLDRFIPKPLLITIVTGGPLGTMTYTWQIIDVGQQDTSATYPTVAVQTAPWSQRVPPAFVDLLWQPGAYVAATTYTIDTTVSSNPQAPIAGVVTPGPGAFNGLTATRFDVRLTNMQPATDHMLGWMAPAVVPPLNSWGSDLRMRTAHYWAGLLLGVRGAAPQDASPGDDRVLARANDAQEWAKSVGRGQSTPQNLVDSSSTAAPPGILLMPQSDTDRGWGDWGNGTPSSTPDTGGWF